MNQYDLIVRNGTGVGYENRTSYPGPGQILLYTLLERK
jgi:hypothetical protein